MGWYIVGAIVVLMVSALLAASFADVAREKGHDESRYFWLCFLFGIPGYLLVIALPDIYVRSALSKPKAKTVPTNTASPKCMPNRKMPEGETSCWACGHVQPKNNGTCSNCGEAL